MTEKIRGFEVVKEDARVAHETFKGENGKVVQIPVEIKLPTRADSKSSGYDFYLPKELRLEPMQKTVVFTDVKAYMQDDEELLLFIRSSLAIKQGLMLSNNVGKIDSSYYNNEDNDGNIGVPLVNTTGKTIILQAGTRFAQGTFYKYLTADVDDTLHEERKGGFGSSDREEEKETESC